MHMADTATQNVAAPASANPQAIRAAGARGRARIAQVAEDVYWAAHRQLEQAIAARTAPQPSPDVNERIAQLKRQIGA
jgi:hypothetical protein